MIYSPVESLIKSLLPLHVYITFRVKGLCQVDIVVLASHLATIGYRVALRTAVGGGTGQKCFRNLCYQFLLVMAHDSPVQYIVDPKFRSELQVPLSDHMKSPKLLFNSFLPD